MYRALTHNLDHWLHGSLRRPLVLRGARQVGKTWLVRDLARRSGKELVEINFERDPGLRRHFREADPRAVLAELSLVLDRSIDPSQCLLFLDEVQAAGDVLAGLRWFYEEMPELPVIAAGSLLEFTLADHAFSMPVGRITYRHVEPLGFPEFLIAHDLQALLASLDAWRPSADLSAATHESATRWFHRYSMVGGMPAVVAAAAGGESPQALRGLQRDLMATYRDDFAKYQGRMHGDVLDGVLLAVARSIGRKFVLAQVGSDVKAHQAKRALDRLAAARTCHLVRCSTARVPPLAGELKDTFRKVVLLDVGLFHALVGTPAVDAFPAAASLAPMLRGQLMEQMTAQQIRLIGHLDGSGPELYYWQRDGGRPGEVDFLVEIGGRIIPVELKAGAAGAMKSLHQFMYDKKLELAVRCDANPPSEQVLDVRTTQGNAVKYKIVNVPHYLIWNLQKILD